MSGDCIAAVTPVTLAGSQDVSSTSRFDMSDNGTMVVTFDKGMFDVRLQFGKLSKRLCSSDIAALSPNNASKRGRHRNTKDRCSETEEILHNGKHSFQKSG